MPAILDAAVRQLKKKGWSTSKAFAIGTATLQKAGELKAGHNSPTKKGVKRGAMSQAQRHKNPV